MKGIEGLIEASRGAGFVAARERAKKLRRSRRGAVSVEYALILVAVAIPAMAGITVGAKMELDLFRTGREAMLDPKP